MSLLLARLSEGDSFGMPGLMIRLRYGHDNRPVDLEIAISPKAHLASSIIIKIGDIGRA